MHITHDAHKAIILFDSEVTPQSIALLVENLRHLIQGLQYTTIDLRILSPGGDAASLRYYIRAIQSWQDQVTITTRALTSVSSASAIMLSLGDERTASEASQLLYHHTRYYPCATAVTSATAKGILETLERYDKEMLTLLATRALRIPVRRVNSAGIDGWHERWSTEPRDSDLAGGFADAVPPQQAWLEILCAEDSERNRTSKTEFLIRAYDDALGLDRPMPAALAKRLGLIDRLLEDAGPNEEGAPKENEATQADGLAVDEWMTIFPTRGFVPRGSLTRHFLIFGETGSGKTRSGVLPMVNAVVKSSGAPDESRVSCAFIIDPKREISAELLEMHGKPAIINLNDGGRVFNVMSSVDHAKDTRTRATDILKRVAALTSNDTSILLGRRLDVRDPYWPTQGVRMATTALRLALWLLEHRARLYGMRELRESLPMEKVNSEASAEDVLAKQRNSAKEYFLTEVEKFGERAGFLVSEETRDIAWMEEQEARCLELLRELRDHGFVVQQEHAGKLWLDELPEALGAVGLDAFLRWVTDGSESFWRAEVNDVTLGRVFDEEFQTRGPNWFPPTAMVGDESGLLTMAIGDPVEYQTHRVGDIRAGVVRSVRAPVIERRVAEPSDAETDLALEQLRSELGAASSECDEQFLSQLMGAGVRLYQRALSALVTTGQPVRATSGSIVLLAVMQDRVCSSFGWTPLPGPHLPGTTSYADVGDSEGSPPGIGNLWKEPGGVATKEARRRRRQAYFRQESLLEAARRGLLEGALADDVADEDGYGDGGGVYSAQQLAAADVGGQPTYSAKDAASAIKLSRLAIDYEKERARLIEEYGAALCGVLLNGEGDGLVEWRRRVTAQVARRNEAVAEILRLRRAVAERMETGGWVSAEKEDMNHKRSFFMSGFEVQVQASVEEYGRRVRKRGGKDWHCAETAQEMRTGPNVIALAERVLQETMDVSGIQMWEEVLRRMSENLADEHARWETAEHRSEVAAWARLAETETSQGQYNTINQCAALCFYEFSQAPASETLYFGCEPYWERVLSGGGETIEFGEFLNGPRQTIFVFQPELGGGGADMIARSLKALFFEAVLSDTTRQRRDHGRPLVAYIADEFHRFITSDKSHGEQSFLDTCRSFGAFCVLACQSTSNMSYVLRDIEGDSDKKVDAAVSILLNNTGTKLFFRTTDVATKEWVANLAPREPGAGSVVDARPLSTLAPGECYAVLVDGRFKRAQLKQWPA